MPQIDLQTLVTSCAGGGVDGKIACETLIADGEEQAAGQMPTDFPPESFRLSKDAEYDWFDRNAFYERKESTKGGNSYLHVNPTSISNSQRHSISLKSKASIIGLPKMQKTTYVDSKRRTCRPPNIRLFPKRTESVGKSATPVAEPGSPKVSCMGRVRSKRCRRRSSSIKRTDKPAPKSSTTDEKKNTRFYSMLAKLFRFNKGHEKPSRLGSRRVVEILMEETAVSESPRRSLSVKVREIPVSAGPVAEPPGLGGMKRFVSGRRSGSWTSDDYNQAVSGESDWRVGRR